MELERKKDDGREWKVEGEGGRKGKENERLKIYVSKK